MATYYWRGGSGTWNNSSTTNWSTSSGGAGGSGPPISGDTVIFDPNSGTAATVTVASTAAATTVNVNKSDIILNFTTSVTFPGTLTFSSGTLNVNNTTLTVDSFSSSITNTRTVAFGTTGKILLTGNSKVIWTNSSSTGWQATGSRQVEANYSGSSGTRTFTQGLNANAVSLRVSAGSDTITSGGTTAYYNLDFTGFSGTFTNAARFLLGNLTLSPTMTLGSGVGSLTFSGTTLAAAATQNVTTNGKTIGFPLIINSATTTVNLLDNLTTSDSITTTLATGTINLNSQTLTTGIFTTTGGAIRNINFGTGSFCITGNNATVWNTGNVVNFIASSSSDSGNVTLSFAGSTGTRVISSGSDSISFNTVSGSDTVQLGISSGFARNYNTTGFSGTVAVRPVSFYGNLTIGATSTLASSSNVWSFYSNDAAKKIITLNGNTLNSPIEFEGASSSYPTWQFNDASANSGSTTVKANTTIEFKNDVTHLFGTLALNGNTTHPIILKSTTPGSQYTIAIPTFIGPVNANGTYIQDSVAIGTQFYSYISTGNGLSSNNVNLGNNGGWIFYDTGLGLLSPISARMLANGRFFAANYGLDEITRPNISIANNRVCAYQLDEVSLNNRAGRFGADGTIYVSNGFSEVDQLT